MKEPEQGLLVQEGWKPEAPKTAMDLLAVALQKDAAIDVIERLAALQREAMARQDQIEFSDALNRVQAEIPRIAPQLTNTETGSKYASYTAIDKVIRPIYSKEGLSLSFNTEDCPLADYVRICCYVSLRGYTRKYQVDLVADGKGPKGGAVMTRTHASGAAISYGKRYLVNMIFNLSIGEQDTDGNLATNGELAEQVEWIQNAKDLDELRRLYQDAYVKFEDNREARNILRAAKDKRKEELR